MFPDPMTPISITLSIYNLYPYLGIPLCRAQEFHHRRIAMIEEQALARIQCGYLLHIVGVQLEVKDVKVLRHSLLPNRFRNDDDVPLRQPAQYHLCDALAVFLRYRGQYLVLKDIVLTLGERPP